MKTTKVKREKGFLFFKKKKGKSSTPPGAGKGAPTPKYSQTTAGAQTRKYSGSRYSQSSARSLFRNIKISPKYSTVAVGSSQGSRSAYPKYSKPISFKGASFPGTPRYSRRPNWKGTRYASAPKYSKPVNWEGTKYASAPRYSRPINWKGASFPASPRYSRPVNWKGTRYASAPRYSKPINWKGAAFPEPPRYSKPINWKGAKFAGTPRYSKPINWKGAYIPGAPRYTSFKHRFVVDERYKKMTRPYTPWLDEYSGDMKYKKPRHKNMHPSVNYLTARNITSKNIKKGLRKWNVFWVQLNPGKLSPKGLRNVAKKPKFDKNERDIWNNGRDKKPSTRSDVTQGAEEPTNPEENDGNNQ